ncbi:UNVERIFIED_CONTAM: hypothetical protein FKN15_011414 [Acipenser sinensis]
MKSLSLRGTHTEKIRSFGEAFKHFTGLRLLDLSRNSIVSLEGIQYLISLEKLNLYYNNVPSLKEVSCLQLLSDLKELDLRLNPVTSSKEDYRLSVVSMLPKLEKLEYRPLPSPPRSSLRSPGKSPTRSKDGFRVTFSDSRAPADPARSSHVAEMDKALSSPGLSGIESTYLCKQHRSVNHAYQTPTALRDETPANSYSDASSIVPRGSCTRLHAEKHAYKSSCVDLLQHQLDKTSSAESSTDRLLKLTSDLYLTTHINNEKATSASSGSSSKKSTVSIELTPQGCMTTPDRSHPAPSVSSRPRVSRGLMEQLNSELLSKKKPSTPAQEKKRFPRPAEFSNSFSPRTELRRAGSLNSVLYTVSDYKRREREATDLTGYHSQSPPSSSSQSISDISSVLKQLLDLVDRYWNGSKSLHLNRRFLTPAHDLLASLTTSPASADSLQRSNAPTGLGVDSAELQQVNWQLMQTQEEQESLKRKVSQLLEENSALRTQVPKTDTKTAASQTIGTKHLACCIKFGTTDRLVSGAKFGKTPYVILLEDIWRREKKLGLLVLKMYQIIKVYIGTNWFVTYLKTLLKAEVRMQEMVSMGVGNKPYLDIKPSDAAINDRAIDYIMKGRGSRTRASIAVSLFDHSNPFKRTQTPISTSSAPTACNTPSSSLLGPLNLHMYTSQSLLPGVMPTYRPFCIGTCIEEDELEHDTSSQPSMRPCKRLKICSVILSKALQ